MKILKMNQYNEKLGIRKTSIDNVRVLDNVHDMSKDIFKGMHLQDLFLNLPPTDYWLKIDGTYKGIYECLWIRDCNSIKKAGIHDQLIEDEYGDTILDYEDVVRKMHGLILFRDIDGDYDALVRYDYDNDVILESKPVINITDAIHKLSNLPFEIL